MPGLWRLKGARFQRDDESWVQPGDVFEPTDVEIERRRFKLEYVGPVPKKAKKKPAAEVSDADAD